MVGWKPLGEWSRATGDWAGARTALEDSGFEIGGTYFAEVSKALSGGLDSDPVFRGLLDLNLGFDPKPLLEIEGAKFFAQFFSFYKSSNSDTAGDLQVYSNIDTGCFDGLGELWYEQTLFDSRLRFKIGQVDANAEFAFVSAASEFINSSAGVSPTLMALPTYPCPALGANLFAYPTEWLYFGAGVYADEIAHISTESFERPHLLAEAGFTHSGKHRLGPGRIAIGGWHMTRETPRVSRGAQCGAFGFFAVAEQQIWKEQIDADSDSQGVSLFAQYGFADGHASEIEHHVGVGLSAVGLLPGRDGDTTGIYWTRAATTRNGGRFDRDESCVEAFYGFQLSSFLTLKTDLQWIGNPGGRSSVRDAWIATMRAIITL